MLHRLSELRKKQNWSLQETADRLGIAKSTYAGYESGYREPSLQSLIQIANLFNTTVDYILNRVDHNYAKIDLAGLPQADRPVIYLDNKPLTVDELYDFIAFTRFKREAKI